jgi:glycerate 2-kinase
MQILIAPNAFKNSLSASNAAAAIEKGLVKSGLPCTTVLFPVGDGGDGTAGLLIHHLQAIEKSAVVTGPLGKPVAATYGYVDQQQTGIVELANASGLRLLQKHEYDPLHATTFGTGELIQNAIAAGAKEIILGIGGSATVDGGTGLLRALGFRFLNTNGKEIIFPKDLHSLVSITEPRVVNNISFHILCDVLNPLLGANGAAAIFGPQKGADAAAINLLEQGLQRLHEKVKEHSGTDINIPHGGAAGGVSAGLFGLLKAQLHSGIDYFLSLTHFDKRAQEASLVITGEGSLDSQSLQGKAPVGVAKAAKKYKKRVIGLAGQLSDNEALKEYFDELIAINRPGATLEQSMRSTAENLEHAAYTLGVKLKSAPL